MAFSVEEEVKRQFGSGRLHAALLNHVDRSVEVLSLKLVPVVVVLRVRHVMVSHEASLNELLEVLLVGPRRNRHPPVPVVLRHIVVHLEVFLAVGRRLEEVLKLVLVLLNTAGLVKVLLVLSVVGEVVFGACHVGSVVPLRPEGTEPSVHHGRTRRI